MAKTTFQELITSLLPSDEVSNFFEQCTKYISKTIYPLYHKHPGEEISAIATKKKRNLTPFTSISPSCMYTLQGEHAHQEVGTHLLHELGLLYVQEAAASFPAQLLDPQAGECILDMCAAPGGKSIQLADMLLQTENPGLVVSNEPDFMRRNALVANIKRTGVRNTIVSGYDATKFGDLLPGYFDKVLVDVPCSGEGMLYKTKQIPSSRQEANVKKLVPLQYKLLESAFKACKPGGTIVYSTCTLNPYENEINIAKFLEAYGESAELEDIYLEGKSSGISEREGEKILSEAQAKKLMRCRPHRQYTGGFFVAKIQKTGIKGETKSVHVSSPISQKNTEDLCTKTVREYSEREFGIELPALSTCVQDETTILLTTQLTSDLEKKIRVEKQGIPLFKKGTKSGYLTPLNYYARVLGSYATKNYLELSEEQADTFLTTQQCILDKSQEEIPLSASPEGFVLLRRKGRGIGLIKAQKITYK